MLKRNAILALALALALGAAAMVACQCDANRERSQPPEGLPERIVSLTPSATEIVAAAGGADLLVGVDRFSAYPEQVADLPEVGDFLNPSFEAIVRLTPDLVVLETAQRKVKPSLERVGIDTLVLDIHDLDDVRVGLRAVGGALDAPEHAEAAAAEIDDAMAEVRERAAARDDAPKVMLVVDRELGGLGDLVVAAAGSFLDEILAAAGGENAFAAAGQRYAKISPEHVVTAAPDVIFETRHTDDSARARADWDELSGVPAVDAGRVYIRDQAYYTAPSPRAGKAVRGLERLLFE